MIVTNVAEIFQLIIMNNPLSNRTTKAPRTTAPSWRRTQPKTPTAVTRKPTTLRVKNTTVKPRPYSHQTARPTTRPLPIVTTATPTQTPKTTITTTEPVTTIGVFTEIPIGSTHTEQDDDRNWPVAFETTENPDTLSTNLFNVNTRDGDDNDDQSVSVTFITTEQPETLSTNELSGITNEENDQDFVVSLITTTTENLAVISGDDSTQSTFSNIHLVDKYTTSTTAEHLNTHFTFDLTTESSTIN